MMQTKVIAVSGHSGAGKTTLVKNLAAKLNASLLLFDEYEESSTYPPAAEWIRQGAHPDRFLTPKFAADVAALKNGESITHPESGETLSPKGYLIIEEPFGKSRSEMKKLIDLAIYIDTPFEIALARRLLRKNAFIPWEDDPETSIKHLKEHLTWYLQRGRDFYRAVAENARKDCDAILNGELPADDLLETALNAVHEQFGRTRE